MKAVQFHEVGGPEVLRYEDVEQPVPAADLDLVGIALRGPRNAVDRIAKGARFHA